MTKQIYGTIKQSNQGGKPVAGLRVQAWDDDFPGADDFMGESITDNEGAYAIPYQKIHWDLAPDGAAKAFPDLYITVDIQNRSKNWVRVGKSRVYKNHDLSRSRLINLRVKIEPTLKKAVPFSPKRYGLHFKNTFVLSPELFGYELAEWSMGFCGGMCAFAAKRFAERRTIPKAAPYDQVPKEGEDLFDDLFKRQLRSMPPLVLGKMLDWQTAPDEDHWSQKPSIGFRTKAEWLMLKNRLDRDQPTTLILIRAHGFLANPTQNHQVLAIGYEYNPSTKDLLIKEYDPNIPDKLSTLKLSLGLPGNQLRLEDSGHKATRGFFVSTAGDAAKELNFTT